jgi:exodeoxyribonuclease V alpha subunit
MTQISGIVSKITFQNEENGFTVLRLQDAKTQEIHICVGIMPTIECGESITVRGEWRNDKRFGLQFNVKAYELIRPTTLEGIRMLLSSGLITDIGPVRAQKIIETFGIKTLDILDNNPEKLIDVPGIGVKRLKSIIQAWQRQSYIKDLMLFLQEFGITLNLIHKIYKAYAEKSKEIISSNPYRLIDDIWGVGFKKADAIARKLGFSADSYRRIKAGIIFVLQDATSEGHVYLPRNDVIEKASTILEIPGENIIYSLDHILTEKVIIADEDRLYLPQYFHAETTVVDLLYARNKYKKNTPPVFGDKNIDEWLRSYTNKTGWKSDPKQIKAVKAALKNKILIITGGPGTGKTTTLHVLVSFFRKHNLHVTLTAPTGRAAQRMGSISGLKAKTIHRLLEFNPHKKGAHFGRNKENPVNTDILICDEVSMIDILLMRDLLNAVRLDSAVVFVGDSNQLPSVGAGNVLADMIESGIIPHVTLTTIFRQAAKSRIVTAAHEIIHGSTPVFSNTGDDNCFFLQKEEPQECLDTIINLVTKRIPKRYNIDPIKDIQVLSPMHKGILGTQVINHLLQKQLNSLTVNLVRGEKVFCKGDKVMQITNNYDNKVFNGDIGYIKRIVEDSGLIVDFGDKTVTYQLADLDELVHAYCISIHKSQGCEFNTVVIPIVAQHYIMLQRNLIYTALTRARNLCILVGTIRALYISVQNDHAFQRYSRLAERLRMKCNLQL